MVELLLKRYLWLIDTLKHRPGLTFEEISNRWQTSYANDNSSQLTKRTFYNHCQAIARHFGIDIECRRGRGINTYSIVNPEAIDDNSLTKWALDSFSLGELLLGNASIADKILLEDIPSGRHWLATIIKALQQNCEIEIVYENFAGVKFTGIVKPLCIKLFKRRWYLLSQLENEQTRIFSLDRIVDLVLTERSFCYPKNFSPAEHFSDFFGIITTTANRKVEHIVIRAYAELPGYLRSLPIHRTQEEIVSNQTYSDFSLHLVPTFDFVQELILHRDQLEILKPPSLRNEIAGLISKMHELYARR